MHFTCTYTWARAQYLFVVGFGLSSFIKCVLRNVNNFNEIIFSALLGDHTEQKKKDLRIMHNLPNKVMLRHLLSRYGMELIEKRKVKRKTD